MSKRKDVRTSSRDVVGQELHIGDRVAYFFMTSHGIYDRRIVSFTDAGNPRVEDERGGAKKTVPADQVVKVWEQ